MRIALLFLFFTPFFSLRSEEITLRSQLARAQERSWIVLEQNKNYTFFYIKEKNPGSIWIEEVTLPQASLQCLPNGSWKAWFEGGAKGHTLWTLSEIDLHNGNFVKSYSYTHQNWLHNSNFSSFMTTLLNLRFSPIPYQFRKRIGLAPPHRKEDTRPLWQPKLIIEGRRMTDVTFGAWQARWPADGSELAKKRIEIYLPIQSETYQYPSYFPYWLEVEGKMGSAKVRIVDSGIEAESPRAS